MGPELHDFQYNFSLIERIAEYVKYEYKILDCRNIIMFTSSDTIMTRRSTVLYQREMLAACQSNIIKSSSNQIIKTHHLLTCISMSIIKWNTITTMTINI